MLKANILLVKIGVSGEYAGQRISAAMKKEDVVRMQHREYSRARSRIGAGRKAALALFFAGMACASTAHAGMEIPVGETVVLDGLGVQDLSCEDLIVNGTLTVSGGTTYTNIGNVVIGSAGVLNATTGTSLDVALSWTNNGTVNVTDNTVNVVNTCTNAATTFSGNTTFDKLSAVAAGHTVNVVSGSELKVAGALTLNGVSVLKQGTAPGFLTLLTGGTQNITSVGVNGVHATRGQHLAPTLDNEIASGDAPNWFRNGGGGGDSRTIAPIPTVGPLGLGLMGVLVAFAAGLGRRWFGKPGSH